MTALFLLGSLPFWALVVVVTFVVIACVEFERSILAGIILVGTIIAVHVWGGYQVIPFIVKHPWWTAGFFGAYLVVGTGWGISKWYAFVKKESRAYTEAFAAFKSAFDRPDYASLTERDPSGYVIRRAYNSTTKEARTRQEIFKDDWEEHKKEGRHTINFEYKPKPKDHKEQIMIWMMYWPWSFCWSVLHDPFKAIYRHIVGFLSHLSDRAFEDAEKQMRGEGPGNPEK